MYPPTSVFIAIGRLGIVVLNGLSYPLQCLPCRACVYHMTSGLIKPKPEPEPETQYQPVSNGENDEEPEEDDYDSEDDPLIPQPDVIGKRLRRRVADMPLWKFYLITIGILLFGFIIALLVDELEIGEFIKLFQGADVSPWIRRINGIDHHLFHPSRILLFQTLQERARSSQMVCSGVGYIWSMRHGFLVSRAVTISANIAVSHSIFSA